jgi:hypothetical protein
MEQRWFGSEMVLRRQWSIVSDRLVEREREREREREVSTPHELAARDQFIRKWAKGRETGRVDCLCLFELEFRTEF